MINQSKKDLRREMKVVTSNLDPRWISKAHPELCLQLNSLVDSLTQNVANRHVLAWIPCFAGEADLAQFIGEVLKDSVLYLPRVNTTGLMEFVQVFDDWAANLVAGTRGILQPREGYGVPFEPPTLAEIFVIIPGLAFDSKGQRLGRGAGHYDRFLSLPELAPAIKIGVCWSMQLLRDVPVDRHDVRVDWICHERGALRTTKDL